MSFQAGKPAVAPSVAGSEASVADEIQNLRAKVLRAITRAQQVYFIDKEPNGTLVFDYLLSALLDCTDSKFGFISSALLKADGTPYLKTHAMSNVAWTKELRSWYAANAHKGLVFTNMNTLHGSVVLTGQPVITNDPSNDPRARGVPPGHPALESFMGIPLFTGAELIGIYGIANRAEGYTEQIKKELEPLTYTIAQMIYAVNERKRRKEAEVHLASVVQAAKEGILSLSSNGIITSWNLAARVMLGLADPDEKKAADVAPPPNLRFQDIVLEIDGKPDYLASGGLDSLAGKVHKAVGQRQDGSSFSLDVSISRGSHDTVFFVAVLHEPMGGISAAGGKGAEAAWQQTVSGVEDGVWDLNMEKDSFFFSANWFRNLGYGEGELAASLDTWQSLLHPEDKEAAQAELQAHFDGVSASYSNEHRLRCKDGSYKWFVHRGRVVLRSDAGEALHFISSHAAIDGPSGRLQQTKAVLSDASKFLLGMEAEGAAQLSMDVNEPATQIVVTAEQLAKTALSEEQKGYVEKIEGCGKQLVALGGAEGATRPAEKVLFNVAQIAEASAMVMADRSIQKGVRIVMEMAPDTPMTIVGDSGYTLELLISLLSASVFGTEKGYVRMRLSTEMVFPSDEHHSLENDEEHHAQLAAQGVYGHDSPQLHLVVAVDGTGCPKAAFHAENSSAVQGATKICGLLEGSLTTMIDPKRGAIYTAKIPVNSTHPSYKGHNTLSNCLKVAAPLLKARVLVVGTTQVVVAAMGKQLNAWHIPHASACTTPKVAFLASYPEGKLPKATLPQGTLVPSTWPNGTPKTGLALDYDVIIVDCSMKVNMAMDEELKQVATILGRDHVGVVIITRPHWSESRRGSPGQAADVIGCFRGAADGLWSNRLPVILHKPMVRPAALLKAIEEAYCATPGNASTIPLDTMDDDAMAMHPVIQEAFEKHTSIKGVNV